MCFSQNHCETKFGQKERRNLRAVPPLFHGLLFSNLFYFGKSWENPQRFLENDSISQVILKIDVFFPSCKVKKLLCERMMWSSDFYAKFELCKKAISDNWLIFHSDATDSTKEGKKTQTKTERSAKNRVSMEFYQRVNLHLWSSARKLRCGLSICINFNIK